MKYVRYCLFVLASVAMAGDVTWWREYLGNGEWGMAKFKGRGDLKPMKEDPSRMMFWGYPGNHTRKQLIFDIPYKSITRLEYRHYITPKQGTQAVTTGNTGLAEGVAADITNAIINAPTETKWLTIFWKDDKGVEQGGFFELVTSFNRNGKMLEDLEARTGLKIRQMQ